MFSIRKWHHCSENWGFNDVLVLLDDAEPNEFGPGQRNMIYCGFDKKIKIFKEGQVCSNISDFHANQDTFIMIENLHSYPHYDGYPLSGDRIPAIIAGLAWHGIKKPAFQRLSNWMRECRHEYNQCLHQSCTFDDPINMPADDHPTSLVTCGDPC